MLSAPFSHSSLRLPHRRCQRPIPSRPAHAVAAGARMSVGAEQVPAREAVVVGGGLGGLAAAISLRKIGIDAQVYERRESISGGEGTMISLFPNGLHALSQLDSSLLPKILNEGDPNYTSQFVTKDGSVLSTGFKGRDFEDKYGMPRVNICWANLLHILRGCLPAHCLHPGHTLTGLEQTQNGVLISLEHASGTAQVMAPLLVASDGIRSDTRRLLFKESNEEHVRDNGRTVWRAIVPFERCSHPMIQPHNTYASAADRRTFLAADAGSGKLYMAFAVMDSEWPQGTPNRSSSGEEAIERLKAFYAGWDLACYCLSIVKPDEMLERRVLDIPVLDQWASGAWVLIGDAVHAVAPALGQGANMAFEDAWELGNTLKGASSVPEALQEFQGFRVPRAKFIADENQESVKWAYAGGTKAMTLPARPDLIFGYKGRGVGIAVSPTADMPQIITPKSAY